MKNSCQCHAFENENDLKLLKNVKMKKIKMYKKVSSLEFRTALRTTDRTTKVHERHTLSKISKCWLKAVAIVTLFLQISWHNCILMYLK